MEAVKYNDTIWIVETIEVIYESRINQFSSKNAIDFLLETVAECFMTPPGTSKVYDRAQPKLHATLPQHLTSIG